MPNLGPNFYTKLVEISKESGINPEDLLNVMQLESGLNPAAINKQSNAVGLIQFMPKTLKGLGYTGSYMDFSKLSGEEQLDYVKKYVQGHGKKFRSAPHYYVANLYPVALNLPGVKKDDPNTIILEQNPQTITVGDKIYSKKYYDIGSKILSAEEIAAYNANKGLDYNHDGNITFGDMATLLGKASHNKNYTNSLAQLTQQTGYSPTKKDTQTEIATKMPDKKDDDVFQQLLNKHYPKTTATQTSAAPAAAVAQTAPEYSMDSVLTKYYNILRGSQKQNKQLCKIAFPTSNILIGIKTSDQINAIEFARILRLALNEELLIDTNTYSDENNVDVECIINGPIDQSFNVINEITAAVVDAFKVATNKIGGINIDVEFCINKVSSYQPMSWKVADTNYRKFLLKFV